MPALIFDCDGVLADTELDGHLPAFNAAFAEFGLPIRWDSATYAEKLKIGGGKERIASDLPGKDDLIRQLHARKTQLFTARVDAGLLPGRPGVRRLVEAVLTLGWTVAVASTSAEASVRAVLAHAVGDDLASRCSVFAGDIVAAKKPAPDIYLLVLADLGLEPSVPGGRGLGHRRRVRPHRRADHHRDHQQLHRRGRLRRRGAGTRPPR